MPAPDFDSQPVLTGATLALRPLAASDLEPLYAAARDPETWAGHPARDRYKRDVFEPYFAFLLESGTTLVVETRDDRRVIGCSRYYSVQDLPDTIAIGFTFLHPDFWGGASNLEMKTLMLEHAFTVYDAVWFHIDPVNIRSQKATAKLGARDATASDIDLGSGPARWLCYRLARDDWSNPLAAR